MEKFVIDGGRPLSGTIKPAGNKNGALPILAACLLTDQELIVTNVPDIADVRSMLFLLESIGVQVDWTPATNTARLKAANVEGDAVLDRLHAQKIRASFLLAGPLLARFGRCSLPFPGGDVIGRRRLDPHLDAFKELGASYVLSENIQLSAPDGLKTADLFMDEPSVMATENVLLAAALIPGTTIIGNAAGEPHVQDLAKLLVKMGAEIDGIGTNQLKVTGQSALTGCTHAVGPDHIEIGSFMALAGVTKGEITIEDVVPEDLRMIRLVFKRLGLNSEIRGTSIFVPGGQDLEVEKDHGDHKFKVQDGPWPAFPADLTSIATTLATQSEGSVLIHEWMFESRLIFTDKLVSMGADITLCDPHRAIVAGKRSLRGAKLSSPDIRAGMALLIAALCADGRSTIAAINQIDRGYENIDGRLRALGAKIDRVNDDEVVGGH